MSDTAERLEAVKARVAHACARAGRSIESVQLIAVSKLHPAERIREAYAAGQRVFGENYAQELRDKAQQLSDLSELRWHAIGPLQSNKAKYVTKVAQAFHALEDLELARELSNRRTGLALECFLEVNLAGESSKKGVSPNALPTLLDGVRTLPNLRAVGLMALPPPTENADAVRPYFRQLRALAERVDLTRLSMGTTQDFEAAIEEGATEIRVGEAIFGPRPTA